MTTRTAAIYLRISKDRGGEALGIDRQRQDAVALAESLGWRVAAVYSDNDLTAYSGKPRPGFQSLLADIEAGAVDAIVAWHVDRLYRHPRDLESFVMLCEDHDVMVRTVRAGELDLSTPSGRMVARILGAVSRQEVEHSTDRVRRSKRQAAEEGRYRGGPRPYGYDPDGMTVRPEEAAVVVDATKRIVAGESLRSVAADLNAHGITTASGKQWTGTELRRVVMRARNVGRIEVETQARPRRTVLGGPAQWPGIVDPELWQQAHDLLTDPSRVTTTRQGGARHLLSGIALCGACLVDGQQVTMRVSGGNRGAARVPTYTCSRTKHVTRGVEQTNAYVGAVLREWLARPEAAEVLAADADVDPVAVMAEVEQVAHRIEQARIMWTEGLLDDAQMRDSVERLRRQEADLLGSLGRGADAAVTVDMLRAGWDALTLDQQRAIVRRFARVVIEPAPRGRPKGWKPGQPYFNPEHVRVLLGAQTVEVAA